MLVIPSINPLKIDLIFMAVLEVPLLIVRVRKTIATELISASSKIWLVEICNYLIFSKN